MKIRLIQWAAAACVLGASQMASASFLSINSVGALAPNDTVNWGQLGAANTAASCFCTWTSANGKTGGINATDGLVRRRDEGNGFLGDFTLLDKLVYQPNSESAQLTSEVVTVRFDNPVKGFGAQFNGGQPGAFDLRINVLDVTNTVVATFTYSGTNLGLENGSAPFFGVLSTGFDIAAFNVRRINPPNPQVVNLPFAFNQLRLLEQTVPEPGSLALVGFGLVGAALARRRRQ